MLLQTSFPCIIFHQLKSFQSLNEHFPANTPVGGSLKSSFSPPYGINRVEKKKAANRGVCGSKRWRFLDLYIGRDVTTDTPVSVKKHFMFPPTPPSAGWKSWLLIDACLRQASETFWTITELTFRKIENPRERPQTFFFF
jgi:hypothetical protein